MEATISPSLGYFILDSENAMPIIMSVLEEREIDAELEKHTVSIIDDWTTVSYENEEDLVKKTKNAHYQTKCLSLIKLGLLAPRSINYEWLCSEIESILTLTGSEEAYINDLIHAPIRDCEKLEYFSNKAMSNGFTALGNILNRVINFQPLINRFSFLWLKINPEVFLGIGRTKEEQWKEFVKTGVLIQILEAENSHNIKRIFGELAFQYTKPKERTSIARLGHVIADALFQSSTENNTLAAEIHEDDTPSKIEILQSKHINVETELNRALTEIDAISKAVASGDDYHALKYLNDLIIRQTSTENTNEYAVKSLCNIAKQCADMFRTDFENICIQAALDLDPTDSWTMIQYGDHLKRIGKYDDAEEITEKAISYGDVDIGRCLLADIASQRGDYEQAIDLYHLVPDWEIDSTARTAIADNLRRLGKLDEALEEYSRLKKSGLTNHRIIAGIADIYRRQNKFDEADEMYKVLLGIKLDFRSWWVNRVTYAGFLKQLGEYEKALELVEEVVAKAPFAMQARVLRSAICGLQDDEINGLNNLPHADSDYNYNAYGEWVSEYTRGLLLLKTSRYKDAQKRLIKNLENSILDKEEKNVLRLAAALSYIADEKITKALNFFSDEQVIENDYLDYIQNVLKYHISVIEKDNQKSEKIYAYLAARKTDNIILWEAVEALQQGENDKALKIEIDSLLRFAA